MTQSAAVQMLKNANANPFAHNLPPPASARNNMHLAHILPRPSQHGGPMIASSPTSVSFENPAMASLYESNQGPFSAQFLQQMSQDTDKWNFHPHQLQQLQAQRGIYTPPVSVPSAPSSAHGNPPVNMFNDAEFMATFQRQQMMAMQQQMGHIYGSPEGDDSSSVGSVSGRRRERSGSMNSGSGYGSPQHSSPLGNYELTGADANPEYGMPKRFGNGLPINTGANGQWVGRGDSTVDGMNGMMKQNMTPPIHIGGGGNGNGFAMMMT
jgi:hypothetical protein